MPRTAGALAALLVLTGALAGPAPARAGGRAPDPSGAPRAVWQPPVGGPIVARFRVGPDRFARGQRRGIDLAAPAGAAVRAPCAGRVAFAGAVPGRGGAVSIRCGALTATILGLDTPRIRGGSIVHAGDRLGVVGSTSGVRLGARVTRSRFGYVDPEQLLGPAIDGPPPLVAPSRGPRAGRGPGGSPRSTPAPGLPAPLDRLRAPAGVPSSRPLATAAAPLVSSAERRVPLAAWLGLVLVAAALPAGALVRRGDRGRAGSAHRAATRHG